MELWTPEHTRTLLPTLGVILIITAILRLTLKNKPLKIRLIPLQIVAVIIVVLEIGKQAVSLADGYDLYALPFHFCSMFIFMLPLAAFYNGAHANRIRGITCALCAALAILMLIYPNLIYPPQDVEQVFKDFLSFHAVVFHAVALMGYFFMVALEIHAPEAKGEVRSAMLFIVCFCIISATMANVLKTNFNNFYSCNIPPLETVRQSIQASLGEVPSRILYCIIVSALDLVFVALSYWVYRLTRIVVCGKKKVSV